MAELAINGGPRVREKAYPPHPIIGDEEKREVLSVLESGHLSTFIAAPGEHFLGGVKIRRFEADFAAYHDVPYAVAFNSATSALHAAVAACGVNPGEEVIVPSYTFTSTATCALMHNAIPVFADIDPEVFCLTADTIKARLTPRTRAVIPVHLFGNMADIDEIVALAAERGLKVIEDCAQAPGATHQGRPSGTIGDCGVFSFQETKNMMTGEGGMLITRNQEIAEVARLVRNHGEMVVDAQPRSYRADILGWGYRMTELEAALGIAQLKKLDALNAVRIDLAERLSTGLREIPGLSPPLVKPQVKHVYYAYPFKYDAAVTGIPRDDFVRAVAAEGIPLAGGYVRPLYFSPLYHENKPFIYRYFGEDVSYEPGICPVTESLHESKLILTTICRPPATGPDIDDLIIAIKKVIRFKDELQHVS